MHNNISTKVLYSCFLAACLELYDFTIFGFFAGAIHKNYLVFMDKQTALIITYALFAVGFVFRPLGSIIFGYIGDIYGRKKALVISVSLMGLASLAMFLLPPYSLIGIVSCYLIALIRIIQGISVGGEYSGAIIYAVEHFDKKKAGLIGGLVICGCMTGVLLATIVSKIVQNPILPDYSWRFAFLIGFGLSIVGYFIRKNLLETPEFKAISSNRSKIPLIEGFKKNTTKCIGTIFIAAANGVNFYFILVFLPGYINKLTGMDIKFYPLLTTIMLIILSPIFSYISDKVNRRAMISYGLIAISIYSFIGLQFVQLYPSFLSAILFLCGHAIIFSTQAATINIFVIEIFPVAYRFSCSSFCYSVGMGAIGGTSPLIASIIIEKFSNPSLYLSYYISAISFLAYISLIFIKKSEQKNSQNKNLDLVKTTRFLNLEKPIKAK